MSGDMSHKSPWLDCSCGTALGSLQGSHAVGASDIGACLPVDNRAVLDELRHHSQCDLYLGTLRWLPRNKHIDCRRKKVPTDAPLSATFSELPWLSLGGSGGKLRKIGVASHGNAQDAARGSAADWHALSQGNVPDSAGLLNEQSAGRVPDSEHDRQGPLSGDVLGNPRASHPPAAYSCLQYSITSNGALA